MSKVQTLRSESMSLDQFPFNITEEEFEIYGIDDIVDEYIKRERMFDPWVEYLLIAFYALFMTLGIVSNVLIIMVILFNKKLKTSNNILLINLFVSDLLLCVFCMPFTLLALIRRSWHFGQIMCKLIPFIQAVSIFVSAATITCIALDRMIQITSNRLIGKSFFSNLKALSNNTRILIPFEIKF